jgi:hypothetical protein
MGLGRPSAGAPMRIPIAIVLCCLAIGCDQRPSEHPSAPALVAESDRRAIAEAVWRYQIKQVELGTGQRWYLKLQGADPSPESLAAFPGLVAPASDFKQGIGVQLSVETIELTEEGAKVEGSWHRGGLDAEGYRYTLRQVGEAWEVTDAVMLWIA